MTRRTQWPLAALVLAVLVLLGVAVPVDAAPPRQHDYVRTALRSTPVHRTVREVVRVPMPDGTAIYVEVTRPAGGGRHPVILEASPYHGTLADRDGTRILPGPTDRAGKKIGLTGYFAPRGYAVVMTDLRGTGRSQGCLDHLGPKDADDLKRIVEWAASRPWSSGRVGMTGHSYVAATTIVAAAQRPRGLVTIVPSAGLASMYDHQFQAGVPYNLQWVGPMFAYEQIAIDRNLPKTPFTDPTTGYPIGSGDNVGNDPHQTGCGAPSSSLTAGESQLSGQYVDWHRVRDWSAAAAASPVSVFMVHGINDNAARIPAMDWFTRRGLRPGDKLWLGQWDHGVGCCPTRRGAQWTTALHAWFDRTLQQRRVDTGPVAEAFLADGTLGAARTGARAEVLEAPAWPGRPRTWTVRTTAGNGLSEEAGDKPGATTFAANAFMGGGVDLAGAPATRDRYLLGPPRLTLVASVTAPRVHLIATLYDEFAGARRRITQFAINPELRDGIDRLSPVVPGMRYELRPPGFAMAHHLRPGHRLILRVSTTDPDKVPTFATDPRVTVFTGPGGTTLGLPLAERPRVLPDTVPL